MGTWNYRVIEFVAPSADGVPENRWRAIHEVHYDDSGRPQGYTENPAVIEWSADEDDSAPFSALERMKAALAKPVLVESDFHSKHGSNQGPVLLKSGNSC